MEEFKDFLKTGSLKGLFLGVSTLRVYDVFGVPEGERTQEDVIPGSIIKTLYYSGVELDFINDSLHKIGIYFRDDNSKTVIKNSIIGWMDDIILYDYKEFVEYANANHIDIEAIKLPFEDEWSGASIRVLPSGVELNFKSSGNSRIDSIFMAKD